MRPDLAFESTCFRGIKRHGRSHFTSTKEAWLKTRVARGDFASVEVAARQLLGERIAELAKGEDGASDDDALVKPYIDEGLAALDQCEFVSLEEHKAHNAALLASLKTS
jgi:antitoxin ParD1/3/4